MSQYLTEDEILQYCNTVAGVQVSDVIIASNLIDGYLGYSFSVNEATETIQLNEKRRGKLRNRPVINIESVKEIFYSPVGMSQKEATTDNVFLDAEMDGYFSYYPQGNPFIYPLDFCSPFKPQLKLEIKYSYGYESVPEEVKYVTAMLAQNIRQLSTFAGAKRLNTLDYTVEMSNPSFFTDDMRSILSKYRYTV